ncbi:MAG: glycosyltransferase family 4 protein, partial [Pseudarthrobacter sp.]
TSRLAWGTFMRTPLYPPLLGREPCLDAEVAHVHGPSPWFDLALLTARRRWRRTVLTVHNSFPQSTRLQRWLGRPGRALLRKTVERSDLVIGPHRGFVEELYGLLRLPTPSDRLRLVPPGVDHERFRPTGRAREYDLVLFVAHVRPEKGLHVLVESMRRLPHLRLEVLYGVSYERSYFEAVRAHAVRSLGGRVRFVEAPTESEMLEAYNRAACVAVPSTRLESWNLVLLEAAACGAACVRSDLPGLAWADFALPAAAGDAGDLAAQIERALAERPALEGKSRDAASQYTWDRTHRESLAACEYALRHGPAVRE